MQAQASYLRLADRRIGLGIEQLSHHLLGAVQDVNAAAALAGGNAYADLRDTLDRTLGAAMDLQEALSGKLKDAAQTAEMEANMGPSAGPDGPDGEPPTDGGEPTGGGPTSTSV